MTIPPPHLEHQWLQQLVGDWIYEHETPASPGKPAEKLTGTETVRSLGDFWILAEGQGQMPGGGTGRMVLTLGYDPQKQQFVGTWVGSMMTNMWVYTGSLDGATNALTLETEGPSFTAEGKTARYKERITIKDNNYRTFESSMQGDDGQWTTFMTAHYRRVK